MTPVVAARSRPASRRTKERKISEPRINDRIRVPEVRLVGPNGEQVGIVRVEDALRLAAEADLDLVEVAPMAKPPVAKLMDFGKFKYEAALKAREARKNQVNTVIKEIKLRPKIDPHDYGTKKGHVERFLTAGDKVKVTIMFRGREQSRPELGFRLLQRLAQDVVELGFVESAPKQDGRNMIMVLGPTRKKADAKAEQRRRASEARQDARAGQAQQAPEQPQEPAAPTEPAGDPVEAPPVIETAEPAASAPLPEPVPEPANESANESANEPSAQAALEESAPAPPTPDPDQDAPAPGPAAPAPPPGAPAAGKPAASAKPAPKPAATPKPVATPKPSAAPKPAAPRPGPRSSAPAPTPRPPSVKAPVPGPPPRPTG